MYTYIYIHTRIHTLESSQTYLFFFFGNKGRGREPILCGRKGYAQCVHQASELDFWYVLNESCHTYKGNCSV